MRIVIAVDPSNPCGWIAAALGHFPLADPLDIVVVSALGMRPPPLTSPGPVARRLYGAAIAALHAEARQAAMGAVETVREGLAARAAQVAVRISDRAPAQAIVQAAVWWSADIILTGPSGAGRVRRSLLGSVPDDVVRAAPCPVLVSRRQVGELQRVLVATDGSLHAEAALRFLVGLPLPASAQVRVSAVSETLGHGWTAVLRARREKPEPGGLLAGGERRAASRAIARAQEMLTGLRCSVQSSLRVGEAARELADEVQGWLPDLVVLGARGRTAGPDVALGSVAEALLRATPCPTLVVRG